MLGYEAVLCSIETLYLSIFSLLIRELEIVV